VSADGPSLSAVRDGAINGSSSDDGGGGSPALAAGESSACGRCAASDQDHTVNQLPGDCLDDVFMSATAFRNAIRDDLDRSIIEAGWRKVILVEGGRSYTAFFRCALSVALAALAAAKRKQLRRPAEGVGGRREHPIDGEAFALHQEEIDKVAGEPAFVLGVHLYSDCTLLSRSGGTLLEPCFPSSFAPNGVPG